MADVCESPQVIELGEVRNCVPNTNATVPDWTKKDECSPFLNRTNCQHSIAINAGYPETEPRSSSEGTVQYESGGSVLSSRLEQFAAYGIDKLVEFYNKDVTNDLREILIDEAIGEINARLDAGAHTYFIDPRPGIQMKVLVTLSANPVGDYPGFNFIDQKIENAELGTKTANYPDVRLAIPMISNVADTIVNNYAEKKKLSALRIGGGAGNFNLKNEARKLRNFTSELQQFFILNDINVSLIETPQALSFNFSDEYELISIQYYGQPKFVGFECLKKSIAPSTAALVYWIGVEIFAKLEAGVEISWHEFVQKYLYPAPQVTHVFGGIPETRSKISAANKTLDDITLGVLEGTQFIENIQSPEYVYRASTAAILTAAERNENAHLFLSDWFATDTATELARLERFRDDTFLFNMRETISEIKANRDAANTPRERRQSVARDAIDLLTKSDIQYLAQKTLLCSGMDPQLINPELIDLFGRVSNLLLLFKDSLPDQNLIGIDWEVRSFVFDILKELMGYLLRLMVSLVTTIIVNWVEQLLTTLEELCTEDFTYSSLSLDGAISNGVGSNQTDGFYNEIAFTVGGSGALLRALVQDVSVLLNLSEICNLLQGRASDQVLTIIYELIQTEKYVDLQDKLVTKDDISNFFEGLGRAASLKICEDLITNPSLNDVCKDRSVEVESARRYLLGKKAEIASDQIEDSLNQAKLKREEMINNMLDLINKKESVFQSEVQSFHELFSSGAVPLPDSITSDIDDTYESLFYGFLTTLAQDLVMAAPLGTLDALQNGYESYFVGDESSLDGIVPPSIIEGADALTTLKESNPALGGSIAAYRRVRNWDSLVLTNLSFGEGQWQAGVTEDLLSEEERGKNFIQEQMDLDFLNSSGNNENSTNILIENSVITIQYPNQVERPVLNLLVVDSGLPALPLYLPVVNKQFVTRHPASISWDNSDTIGASQVSITYPFLDTFSINMFPYTPDWSVSEAVLGSTGVIQLSDYTQSREDLFSATLASLFLVGYTFSSLTTDVDINDLIEEFRANFVNLEGNIFQGYFRQFKDSKYYEKEELANINDLLKTSFIDIDAFGIEQMAADVRDGYAASITPNPEKNTAGEYLTNKFLDVSLSTFIRSYLFEFYLKCINIFDSYYIEDTITSTLVHFMNELINASVEKFLGEHCKVYLSVAKNVCDASLGIENTETLTSIISRRDGTEEILAEYPDPDQGTTEEAAFIYLLAKNMIEYSEVFQNILGDPLSATDRPTFKNSVYKDYLEALPRCEVGYSSYSSRAHEGLGAIWSYYGATDDRLDVLKQAFPVLQQFAQFQFETPDLRPTDEQIWTGDFFLIEQYFRISPEGEKSIVMNTGEFYDYIYEHAVGSVGSIASQDDYDKINELNISAGCRLIYVPKINTEGATFTGTQGDQDQTNHFFDFDELKNPQFTIFDITDALLAGNAVDAINLSRSIEDPDLVRNEKMYNVAFDLARFGFDYDWLTEFADIEPPIGTYHEDEAMVKSNQFQLASYEEVFVLAAEHLYGYFGTGVPEATLAIYLQSTVEETFLNNLSENSTIDLLFNFSFPLNRYASIMAIYSSMVVSQELGILESFALSKEYSRKIIENLSQLNNYMYQPPDVVESGGYGKSEVKRILDQN